MMLALQSIHYRIIFFIFILFITSCGNSSTPSTPSKDETILKQQAEQLYGKEASYDRGKQLFKQQCAVCHTTTDTKLTGPGLQGIRKRVPSGEWLRHFLSNPDSMYKTQDSHIVELKKEHPYNSMASFSHLSPQEIKDLIAFIHVQ
jgi:cytochrome c2